MCSEQKMSNQNFSCPRLSDQNFFTPKIFLKSIHVEHFRLKSCFGLMLKNHEAYNNERKETSFVQVITSFR